MQAAGRDGAILYNSISCVKVVSCVVVMREVLLRCGFKSYSSGDTLSLSLSLSLSEDTHKVSAEKLLL